MKFNHNSLYASAVAQRQTFCWHIILSKYFSRCKIKKTILRNQTWASKCKADSAYVLRKGDNQKDLHQTPETYVKIVCFILKDYKKKPVECLNGNGIVFLS